jgi:hypothetical protein
MDEPAVDESVSANHFCPLHHPAAFVQPQIVLVFVAMLVVVVAMGNDQVNCTAAQSLAQRIGIVIAISNHPLRCLPQPIFRSRETAFGQPGFLEPNFIGAWHSSTELPAEDRDR